MGVYKIQPPKSPKGDFQRVYLCLTYFFKRVKFTVLKSDAPTVYRRLLLPLPNDEKYFTKSN